ncbi:guanine nucleotide-binding protein subunit beta-2-like [Artemia franciscana]|uniref:Guanine nucleotide-binding protein subunit beta-2 n=1 Tax=Artemia franciscana TaxID=6661 RepID=A0AA88I106_ARTSF|nr:hypothetical protein QYM36_006732 [Artemia franciscana]
MPKDDPEITKLKNELQSLIQKFQDAQKTAADTTLETVCGSMSDVPKIRMTTKKVLKGHINKVTCCDFAGDSRHVVSGSLDGKLIIWDAWTGNKVQVIPLRSAWVMSSVFAKSGNFVACGGMDNMCTVYDLNNRDSSGSAKIVRELAGYEGFLSCSRFFDDKKIITGSGDTRLTVWDLESGKKLQEINCAHAGDVCSMSMSSDQNTLVTGSVDRTMKVWDMRDMTCQQTFFGHESDVNSVCMHPSGFAFCSASEDKTARLFDIRADQQIGLYRPPTSNSGFTSSGLSRSGRYLFAGSDDSTVHVWDIAKAQHVGNMQGHENRITSLSVSENGMAVATGSWDNYVKIWL